MKYIPRLLIIGLIIFEFLNQFGILHYTLDFTWIGLIITASAIWIVVENISFYLKKSCGGPMASWTMFIVVCGVYIDALGDILHFYGKFGWYDQLAHLAGGAAVAVVVFNIIRQLHQCQKINLGLFGQGFFAIAAAAFFGALYEIEEYLEDFFTNSRRLGDGPDTANDLMLDILGAVVIIFIINLLFFIKKKLVDGKSNRFAVIKRNWL